MKTQREHEQDAIEQTKRICVMTDAELALSDDECQELMDLYRITRNAKATDAEIKRCRELIYRREEMTNREMR